MVNSTFSGNSAGARTAKRPTVDDGAGGAAILMDPAAGGSLRITWSTFSGNVRKNEDIPGAANSVANAQVGASLFADPAPACRNITTAGLPNVVPAGETSCNNLTVPGDARLGALADNGGPTQTLLPGTGSVALNALAGVPCPATDQRGLPRPALGACDAGAVEVQPGAPGAPGGGGGTTAGKRTIAKLRLGPPAFRTHGRKAGTTVHFTLDAAGRVVLTVTKPASGRRSKGRCVAPTRRLSGARRCTRQVTLPGKLTLAGTLGANSVRFSGKLRGKALTPGSYVLVLTLPRSGASAAVSARRAFRILP